MPLYLYVLHSILGAKSLPRHIIVLVTLMYTFPRNSYSSHKQQYCIEKCKYTHIFLSPPTNSNSPSWKDDACHCILYIFNRNINCFHNSNINAYLQAIEITRHYCMTIQFMLEWFLFLRKDLGEWKKISASNSELFGVFPLEPSWYHWCSTALSLSLSWDSAQWEACMMHSAVVEIFAASAHITAATYYNSHGTC